MTTMAKAREAVRVLNVAAEGGYFADILGGRWTVKMEKAVAARIRDLVGVQPRIRFEYDMGDRKVPIAQIDVKINGVSLPSGRGFLGWKEPAGIKFFVKGDKRG